MAPKAKRAALIGFDCLVPKRLQKLLKEGGLDNFRRFIKAAISPKASTCPL